MSSKKTFANRVARNQKDNFNHIRVAFVKHDMVATKEENKYIPLKFKPRE